MARLSELAMAIMLVSGCSTKGNADACELLAAAPKGDVQTVVYVHALETVGGDYIFAYGLGCENPRAEMIELDKLKEEEGLSYIGARSVAGYSVPYDALVRHNEDRGGVIVTLIKRNFSFSEILFIGDEPPPPPAKIPGTLRN